MLASLGVVVVNELVDRCHKLFVGLKVVQIIHLALQDAPEAFRRTVVNTSADSGHALRHFLFVQPRLKLPARVLKPSVTMEQRMRVRILFDRQVKCIENKLVVIMLANGEGDNISAFQVQNSA